MFKHLAPQEVSAYSHKTGYTESYLQTDFHATLYKYTYKRRKIIFTDKLFT